MAPPFEQNLIAHTQGLFVNNNNNNNILLFILRQFQAKKPNQRRST